MDKVKFQCHVDVLDYDNDNMMVVVVVVIMMICYTP
jgi:hypothetical protein